MRVTQNNDGSLTVDIAPADLTAVVVWTMKNVPVADPLFTRRLVLSLSDAFADALRAANVAFDQAVTDATAVVVQGLADTRAAAAAKVGP